ncbi:TPA: hypothetical protein R8V11_001683, partial [Campylobacter jejuni]|nr:hypothetical protein [Campylobacter jejuni]
NLSLGGASTLHILYEFLRFRNESIVIAADLIILESNIVDIDHIIDLPDFKNLILRNIFLTYNELSKLNKKFLVLLLPYIKNDFKKMKLLTMPIECVATNMDLIVLMFNRFI